MPSPLLVAAGVKAGTSIFKYLTRPKQRKFEETSYAQRLKKRMEEGVYSPGMRAEMVGDVARASGGVAQREKAGYRGRLASMGMLKSISGASKLADIGTQHGERLAETSRRIGRENVLARGAAADEFARAKTGYTERVKALEDKAKGEFIRDFAGGVGEYFTGKAQLGSIEGVDFSDTASTMSWAMSQQDPAGAMRMLQSQGYLQRYMDKGMGETDIMKILSENPDRQEEILNTLNSLGMLSKSLLDKLQ